MLKRLFFVIVILAVIFGGTLTWHIIKEIMTKHYFATYEPPPVTVSTSVAKKMTWHPNLKSIGTLEAVNGVEINSELPGQVVKINFHSGQYVKKGDLLVELDDSIDLQNLKNNQAALHLDISNYQRQVKLYKLNATPKLDLDTAQAKMLQSQSQVDSAKVTIEKKHIRAPFDGKLGIRKIDIGEYISPGMPMVSLQSLNPLLINFDLSEQALKLIHHGQTVVITTEGLKGKRFEGKVVAIDSSISVATRSISVQALVPNEKLELYPGLFVKVKLILPEEVGVITLPQTAISYSLYGDSIYVVQKSKDKKGKSILTVRQQFVTVGERRGTVVAISKGIKAGDVVVTSGQLKLHPGSHIQVNNSIELK